MSGTRSCGLMLLAVLLCSTLTVAKAATVGASALHRDAVDESRYPWSSIGKLYNESGSSCSGVVISRDKILTAAHCLFNYRTQRFVTADALHFLVGYRTGRYSVHVRVERYEIGAGFNPLQYDATSQADWAILTATERLPADIEPLRLRRDLAPSGTKAVLAGYPQDRAFAMTADRDCELRDEIDSGRLLLHTCRGIKGYSGAPILIGSGGYDVQVAGIQIATLRGNGAVEMLAVPAQSIAPRAYDAPVVLASAGTGDSYEAETCRDNPGPVLQLADVQAKLNFIPPPFEPIDADPFDIVSVIPERRIVTTTAIAWLAVEPYFVAFQ